MKTFFEPLKDLTCYKEFEKLYADEINSIAASGCVDTQKAHFLEAMGSRYRFKVVIGCDEAAARQLAQDCRFFDKSTMFYPAKDFIFYSADIHGNQLTGERLKCIDRIINAKNSNGSLTIVTTIDACCDILIPLERYEENTVRIEKSQIIDVEELSKKLVSIGYERCSMIENQGQFAVRGGIIDIFSYTQEAPVRIELWDDEIDSIRIFDVESQRSIETVRECEVFPATEVILTENEIASGIDIIRTQAEGQLISFGDKDKKKTQENVEKCNRIRRFMGDIERSGDFSKFLNVFCENTVAFIDYFPKDDTIFVLDESLRIKERMKLIEFEYEESMKNRLEGGYILPCQTTMMLKKSDVYSMLRGKKVLLMSILDDVEEDIKIDSYVSINAKGVASYNNSFEYLVEDLRKYRNNKYSVILVCNSRTRAARIVDDLRGLDVESYFSEDFSKRILPGAVMVTYGNLHKGFEYVSAKLAIIAENDIFTVKSKKEEKKKHSGKAIASFNELNVGDYVIHENYGIGIYKGIEKLKVDYVEKDYIKVEYADKGELFVLATELDHLQKYASADAEKKPKINKLGGMEWKKTKAKVTKAVEEVAKELVQLYAIREKQKGYQFGPDTVWQREFEEMFPYEETKDQLTAIEDTKRDMESDKIMDRLICGDVGYGKTEVAIRAAFKAVQEGKQVAYLVPTTILAQQVYNTFSERMKDFPVIIRQLSSFRTSSQNKESINELKRGMVDIIIGTHRVLSKDVEFKDLGLLIVDEEQRFGVTHKEKIKKLKTDVDVLTLSATPIPRTLHMSLVGIRNMSVLEEPPVDRVPIQTFVTEHNDEMIREAIGRELARKGQVYYVYNRVRNIEETAMHIQELVPDAVVGYAHGQMDKRELEKIMLQFINKEIDVLVSTTIIETGMDISNVNTMIIEDADKFGLSQLYQLRGRVGRSSRTAYAFLLYRRDRMITEVAQKRLGAIKEFSDFGSGFKIAMKDLEIRGAGNVLGKSQHGHMAAVGYDLYCKLLNSAVSTLKGIEVVNEIETRVELGVDAYIPATYIRSEYQKLDIYKRIAAIESREELSDMKDELSDRYGELPKPAINLMNIALIKAMANKIGITCVKDDSEFDGKTSYIVTIMTLSKKSGVDMNKFDKFCINYGGALSFRVSDDKAYPGPRFEWRVTKQKFGTDREYLSGLTELLKNMKDKCM